MSKYQVRRKACILSLILVGIWSGVAGAKFFAIQNREANKDGAVNWLYGFGGLVFSVIAGVCLILVYVILSAIKKRQTVLSDGRRVL